jgi:hypothetical protein
VFLVQPHGLGAKVAQPQASAEFGKPDKLRPMSQFVSLPVQGPHERVIEVARAIRMNIGPTNCTIWSPPRWQEGDPEQVRETFEVELYNAQRRDEAQELVRQAVAVVDPDREVIATPEIGLLPVE